MLCYYKFQSGQGFIQHDLKTKAGYYRRMKRMNETLFCKIVSRQDPIVELEFYTDQAALYAGKQIARYIA